MYSGTTEAEQSTRVLRPSFRLPSVYGGGGVAIVSSRFAIPGQPTRGGNSTYRSVRQASGAWTQTSADPDLSHTLGLPDAWTADFSKIVWYADAPGADKALSADGRTITFDRNDAADPANDPAENNVYQQTDGGAERQVNVATDGTPIENASLQSISDDAGQMVFAADDGTGARLYLRDGSTTYPIDRARQTLSARTDSRVVGALADRRTVFFMTRDRLLPDDANDDYDIYRWSEADDSLRLVSAGAPPTCAAPLPTANDSQVCDSGFAGVSPDGEYEYFVSTEQLGGANGAVAGQPNLYVRKGQGPITYAFTLDGAGPGLGADPLVYDIYLSANATVKNRGGGAERDGTFVAVSSRAPSGERFDQAQVVRYDPRTGVATCISCGANGSSDGGNASLGRLGPGGEAPAYNATADGSHVFFNTTARLVTEDHNSAADVYDYDVATGERTLVSAGSGVSDSSLAGISDDGTDVLFQTEDTLVGRDLNGTVTKVYDARRGGGEAAPSSSAPCGLACQAAPPAPPPFALSDSATPGLSDGNVAPAPAVRLAVGAVSAAQRRALARGGKLTLVVRTSDAATVRAKATARVGRSTATVASGSVKMSRAGKSRVALRLSKAARRQLRAKRTLKVTVTVSVSGGTASKRLTLALRSTATTKAGAR